MLTTRGFWLLLFVFLLLGVGLVARISSVGMIGGTLLLWFTWGWLLFSLRVRWIAQALRVSRELRDERGPVASLWAGQTFQVRASLWLDDTLALPYVKIMERIPMAVDNVQGDTDVDGPLASGQPLELTYQLHCPSAGVIRFEGLAFQMADVQGFFYHATFVRSPRLYRVLPPLADAKGHIPAVKRHNMLPLLGVHPHRRPGSGSELLDLRDYMIGDPPKTIAWKASARRGRLMTKVFESEVPVRCTLFVDTSSSVRVGLPGRNALARVVEISAAVAQASAAARDLTGLCLFDEHGAAATPPGRGQRHVVQLLQELASAAGLAPSTGEAQIAPLVKLGFGLAQEIYPALLDRDINRSPWWLPWLWPQPLATIRRPFAADRVDRALSLGLVALWLVATGFLLWVTGAASPPADAGGLIIQSVFGVGVAAVTGVVAFLLFWLSRAYVFFMPARRQRLHRRKRLAAVLSVHYGLAPGGLPLLLEDDEQFSLYVQRFLAEHQVPYPLPMFDRKGRYLFAAPGKIPVLARELTRAVGRGRDNELFVLLVDLLDLEDQLGPLLAAIKLARARHHRVLVISPWPAGVKPPDSTEEEVDRPGDGALKALVRRTTTSRFHGAYHRLRRAFSRRGVQMVCARGRDPVKLILHRLEQLRLGEVAR